MYAALTGAGLSWALTAVAALITGVLIAYRVATRHRRRTR